MTKKKLKTSKSMHTRLRDTPIAIIGMAGLFPNSIGVQEYWENIFNKVDCITEVPQNRWKLGDYYDPDPKKPDKTYSKKGGFIPDIQFDPMEFGLPPNILEVTDSSQLLSLVVTKELLHNAGYGKKEFDKSRTGVILGVVGGQKLGTPLNSRLQYPVWKKVLQSSGISSENADKIVENIKKAYIGWEEDSFPGLISNVIAGRVANRFDLGGINCVVDAACAGSLAAIKMAVSELLEHRADMMITGGVDTDNSPGMYMCFSKTPAFTEEEKVQPFDEKSKGIMIGEAVGMILLKRLEDAEKNNDPIYAVIKGIGSSSDGRSGSIYAPCSNGQSSALDLAYQDAGFNPASIGLIEAHGTGTSAGDIAEFQGLKKTFEHNLGEKNENRQHIALGTVKSQIAHTKGAAGCAGLIKIALALHHKVFPPTLNIDKPHSNLDIENSPFYLNTETRPWITGKSNVPRRASVSSFGFGGSNFHMVLEEYQHEHQGAYKLHQIEHPVILTAETPDDLMSLSKEWLGNLEKEHGEGSWEPFLEKHGASNPSQEQARVGFSVKSMQDAIGKLKIAIRRMDVDLQEENWSIQSIHYRKTGIDPNSKTVALFSGQGSQYVNMGKDLAMHFPEIRDAFGTMEELFQKELHYSFGDIVFPPPVFDENHQKTLENRLQLTQHAQPAIGSFSTGLYKLMQKAGFKADFTAGHSYGELTALWASGVLSEEDYYWLTLMRGQAMKAPDQDGFDSGGMLAVMAQPDQFKKYLSDFPEISFANWNSPTQVVLAGPKMDILQLGELLQQKDFTCAILPVSAAFHSPLVSHAQQSFQEAIGRVTFEVPQIPVFSNTTGQAYPESPEEIKKILSDQILNPVFFKQEIESIASEGGTVFVEFGPKSLLTKLVESILQDRPHHVVSLNANNKSSSDSLYRDALIQLRVLGLSLSLKDSYQKKLPQTYNQGDSRIQVTLNGANYVSPATKKAFEDALNEPPFINGSDMNKPSKELPQTIPANTFQEETNTVLSQFYEHQSQTLKVHAQYLSNQQEYFKAFADLIQHQYTNYVENQIPVPQNIEQGMRQFQEHQHETAQIHAAYLNQQSQFSQNTFHLIQNQYAMMSGVPAPTVPPPQISKTDPAVPLTQTVDQPEFTHHTAPPAPTVSPESAIPKPAVPKIEPSPPESRVASPVPATEVSAAMDLEQLKVVLLGIVSEKTGFPEEMLKLTMDMEVDLGIDSIKRVEILADMENQFPSLPTLKQEKLAETRTLEEIVEYVKSQAESSTPPDAVSQKTAPMETPSDEDNLNLNELGAVMIEIVSEKTGFPAEMLKLTMDMEVDLGIDSIKRVEILADMERRFPNLPPLKQEKLAETRTLEEIVEYVSQQMHSAEPKDETDKKKSPIGA
ncbi:MAG: acyltransferase domain-containing protein [SAR324 cluster bacterium]|nr:acyltransferase domain-containing protein [SAR324 cluster bacterium]